MISLLSQHRILINWLLSVISPPFASPPFPSRPGISIPILGRRSKRLLMAKNPRRIRKKRTKQNQRRVVRIHVLPDDVLLEIFGFYVGTFPWYEGKTRVEEWQTLVHVCQRWRSLVLASPRRLNLQLYCTPKTPARDTLDIWPALPLIVCDKFDVYNVVSDNVIAALEQSNRVRLVNLHRTSWRLEKVLATMQAPFPELTDLLLISDTPPPVIPDSFLGGGSAPRLQKFELDCILFPGLPKLLLSATHLVYLGLLNIPHSGYISPEAIVALLSTLSSLESLSFAFQSSQSRPDSESPSLPPPKRSILPALTELYLKVPTEYLEELVTRIDTPQLDYMGITFFNQFDLDAPRLAQFINCTPTLRARDKALLKFNKYGTSVVLLDQSKNLDILILCEGPDRQLSTVAHVCNSLPPLSTVEDLYIEHRCSPITWNNDATRNALWLQLLLQFTAVNNLYLSEELAPGIAAALQELIGSRITEVLPSLQNIFVEKLEPSGPFQENIGPFVAARQLSGDPISISHWDKVPEMVEYM